MWRGKKAVILAVFVMFETALPATAAALDPVRIGWIGPLSGSAAALGVDSVPAIQMVFDEVNARGGISGRRLELVVEDDQYLTAKTVTAYQKLVHQEGIRVIYIITYGGLFAVAPQAERDGVLLLDPLDCDDAIAALPQSTICIAKKTEDLGFVIAESAVAHNDAPAGIIYFDGDPFMGTAAAASRSRFEQLGAPAAYAESYQAGTTDFKPLLLRAKNRGMKSLFIFGYDEMGLAMKQARELRLTVPFYAVNTITSPGCRNSAGAAAEGSYVVNWLAPRGARYAEFMGKFQERTGRAPFLEISTIPSFDIAELLANFLKRDGVLTNAGIQVPELRRAFYALKDYQGLSGSVTIDPDGITRTLKNRMFVFRGGELVP